jgi:hypothetical protein
MHRHVTGHTKNDICTTFENGMEIYAQHLVEKVRILVGLQCSLAL